MKFPECTELKDSTDIFKQEDHLMGDTSLPPFPSPYLVGLVAHNNIKPAMMKFVQENISFFSRVKLVTTGSTGKALSTLGLQVEHKVSSGPLGGDQEIGALIAQGKVCAVFFFTDPLSAHPHSADVQALNRICNVHDILIASNPATARCLVHAMEHSDFGYSCMTGLNVVDESEVVKQYKKKQEAVIAAVSSRRLLSRRSSSKKNRAELIKAVSVSRIATE